MKKSLISISLLASISLYGDYFSIVNTSSSISLDTIKSSINKVYYSNANGLLDIYDGSSDFNFALTTTKVNSLYILNTNLAPNISGIEKASNGTISKECEVSLVKGFNVTSLPTMNLSTSINGASIKKVYYPNDNGLLDIYDATSQFNFALTSTEEGSYYIVNASSASTGSCQVSNEDNTTIEEPPSTPDLNGTTTDTNGTDKSIGLPPQVPSV